MILFSSTLHKVLGLLNSVRDRARPWLKEFPFSDPHRAACGGYSCWTHSNNANYNSDNANNNNNDSVNTNDNDTNNDLNKNNDNNNDFNKNNDNNIHNNNYCV